VNCDADLARVVPALLDIASAAQTLVRGTFQRGYGLAPEWDALANALDEMRE